MCQHCGNVMKRACHNTQQHQHTTCALIERTASKIASTLLAVFSGNLDKAKHIRSLATCESSVTHKAVRAESHTRESSDYESRVSHKGRQRL